MNAFKSGRSKIVLGHVEVFQMDGVAISIIGRPRPLAGHDTPNPANNTYTLNYEEPSILSNKKTDTQTIKHAQPKR